MKRLSRGKKVQVSPMEGHPISPFAIAEKMPEERTKMTFFSMINLPFL